MMATWRPRPARPGGSGIRAGDRGRRMPAHLPGRGDPARRLDGACAL